MYVINPEQSAFLERWDRVTMFALVYVAIVSPIQVALLEAKLDGLFGLNCCVDFIFVIDMVLQFFIMFPKKTSYGYSMEHRPDYIAKRYLRTWFTIDFVSIIPFDLFTIVFESENMSQLKALKVVRLLRLMKLMRIVRASRLFRRLEVRMSITYKEMALTRFFIMIFIVTHWLANLWALTLILVEEEDGLPRWVDTLTDLEEHLPASERTDSVPWKLYVASLYFTSYTFTSVGYGDIGPKNILERVVCTVMIVISGVSWAIMLGQVCGIVANMDEDEQSFRSMMDELNFMMRDRAVPVDLRHKLRGFVLSNKAAQRRARHQLILPSLSDGLQGEIALHMNREWINQVGFLRQILAESENTGLDPFYAFVIDVSQKLVTSVHAQSEVFGVPQVLYILSRGLVSRHIKLLRSGAVWGEDFVLSDVKLAERLHCFALTYVEVQTLHRETFLRLVHAHQFACPDLKRRVRQFCCWTAFQRAILREARRRRAFLADEELATPEKLLRLQAHQEEAEKTMHL